MSLIFYEPFTSDLSFFTTTVTDSGDFAWTASGPESQPGIAMTVDDTAAIYGRKDHTALTTQTDARFGGYLNLSTISIPSGGNFGIFVWRTSGGTQRIKLRLFYDGDMKFIHELRGDDNTVDQNFVSLGGATALRWEIHVSKTNGESKLYWDTGGSGLLLKDTSSKVITNTFDDQTQIFYGAVDSPTSGITGQVLLGPLGFRDDSTAIGAYSWNSAPVLTVPGAQTCTLGTQKSVENISVADTDSNLSTIRVQVTGSATCTVTLSGCTVSAGTNGTNDFTITGTQANLNTAIGTLKTDLAQVAWTDGTSAPPAGHISATTTITVTATDSGSLSDSETITCNWTMATGNGTQRLTFSHSTLAGINAATAVASYIPNTNFTGTDYLYVKVTDGNGNTDEAIIEVVVSQAVAVVKTIPHLALSTGVHL